MLWLPAIVLAAGGAQDLARQYRDDPSAAARAALSRFAAAHSSDQSGAQARLALASTDYERAQYADVLADLKDLEMRLPSLTDYIVYLRSAAQYAAQRYGDAVSALVPLWSFTPASPVTPKAVLTAAHAYLDAKQPADAVTVLTRYIDSLPSPQGMSCSRRQPRRRAIRLRLRRTTRASTTGSRRLQKRLNPAQPSSDCVNRWRSAFRR